MKEEYEKHGDGSEEYKKVDTVISRGYFDKMEDYDSEDTSNEDVIEFWEDVQRHSTNEEKKQHQSQIKNTGKKAKLQEWEQQSKARKKKQLAKQKEEEEKQRQKMKEYKQKLKEQFNDEISNSIEPIDNYSSINEDTDDDVRVVYKERFLDFETFTIPRNVAQQAVHFEVW